MESTADVATLAELLHETEQHHGPYEKTHGEHNWWDWYAPYLGARQNGSSPKEAAAAAASATWERSSTFLTELGETADDIKARPRARSPETRRPRAAPWRQSSMTATRYRTA